MATSFISRSNQQKRVASCTAFAHVGVYFDVKLHNHITLIGNRTEHNQQLIIPSAKVYIYEKSFQSTGLAQSDHHSHHKLNKINKLYIHIHCDHILPNQPLNITSKARIFKVISIKLTSVVNTIIAVIFPGCQVTLHPVCNLIFFILQSFLQCQPPKGSPHSPHCQSCT